MQRGPPNVFCLVVGQPSSTSRSLGNFDQYVCKKVVLCFQIEIQFTKYFVGCRWYINLLLLLLFSVGHSAARSIAVGHLHPQRDFFQNIFPLESFFLQNRQVCDTKASWILAVKMVAADSVKKKTSGLPAVNFFAAHLLPIYNRFAANNLQTKKTTSRKSTEIHSVCSEYWSDSYFWFQYYSYLWLKMNKTFALSNIKVCLGSKPLNLSCKGPGRVNSK